MNLKRIPLATGLLLTLAACSAQEAPTVTGTRAQGIYSGTLDSDDAPMFASVVSLAYGRDYFCSGVLVTPRFVLAAAHCFENGARLGDDFEVHFSATSTNRERSIMHTRAISGPVVQRTPVPVDSITDYQRAHDLVLVRLDRAVPPNWAHPMRIHGVGYNQVAETGTNLIAVGFGPTFQSAPGAFNSPDVNSGLRSYGVPQRIEWDNTGDDYWLTYLRASSGIPNWTGFEYTEPYLGAVHGDSGGPLVSIDQYGQQVVVGVCSGGNNFANEWKSTHWAPVGRSDNDAWLRDHLLLPDGELRDTCFVGAGAPDSDGDGVQDGCDNCPNVYNGFQDDTDGDGAGDACDSCYTDPLVTDGPNSNRFDEERAYASEHGAPFDPTVEHDRADYTTAFPADACDPNPLSVVTSPPEAKVTTLLRGNPSGSPRAYNCTVTGDPWCPDTSQFGQGDCVLSQGNMINLSSFIGESTQNAVYRAAIDPTATVEHTAPALAWTRALRCECDSSDRGACENSGCSTERPTRQDVGWAAMSLRAPQAGESGSFLVPTDHPVLGASPAQAKTLEWAYWDDLDGLPAPSFGISTTVNRSIFRGMLWSYVNSFRQNGTRPDNSAVDAASVRRSSTSFANVRETGNATTRFSCAQVKSTVSWPTTSCTVCGIGVGILRPLVPIYRPGFGEAPGVEGPSTVAAVDTAFNAEKPAQVVTTLLANAVQHADVVVGTGTFVSPTSARAVLRDRQTGGVTGGVRLVDDRWELAEWPEDPRIHDAVVAVSPEQNEALALVPGSADAFRIDLTSGAVTTVRLSDRHVEWGAPLALTWVASADRYVAVFGGGRNRFLVALDRSLTPAVLASEPVAAGRRPVALAAQADGSIAYITQTGSTAEVTDFVFDRGTGGTTRRRRYRVQGVATPVVARNAQGDLALVVARNGVETTELLHALDGRVPGAREGWL